jgi:Domain of unknown function (DUF1905)
VSAGEILAELSFTGVVIEWRGPAPFFFVAVPEAMVGEIRYAARQASYGWGCVPVAGDAGGVTFTTSLFPRDGGYLVPLKVAVRRKAGIVLGDPVDLRLTISAVKS